MSDFRLNSFEFMSDFKLSGLSLSVLGRIKKNLVVDYDVAQLGVRVFA